MKIVPIIFFIHFFLTGPASGQSKQNYPDTAAPYFQQKTDYNIEVTLNDVDHTLDAFESIAYTNNSPDTLSFIWFHLWPNAYKNDQTAFSEQLLQLGRTDFYFSNYEQRGYINRLDFKVDGVTATLEDHPLYIDIVKLLLPEALPPGKTIKITTPFHEKLPFNFSRGGHVGHTYQITQWYPKPAVYDRNGWHAMPYLEQGEFYSEFGNFDVQITLPKDYVVAATGELQNNDERNFLKERADTADVGGKKSTPIVVTEVSHPKTNVRKKNSAKVNTPSLKKRPSRPQPKTNPVKPVSPNPFVITKEKQATKTINYHQENVHDFAWFADKDFIVNFDTLQLTSGRVVSLYSFYSPAGRKVWKNSLLFIKKAIRTRSMWLGEYPYNIVSAIEAKMGFSGGMEYPTITSISPMPDESSLELTIEHEVGHNWNYGILGSNERLHPWMDEGINTYFDNRYKKLMMTPTSADKKTGDFFNNKIPSDETDLFYRTEIANKKDQPIETSSEQFSALNYGLIAYYKTGAWMTALQDDIGEPSFDSCLHAYYDRWKFKHPQPEDFEKVIEDVSGKKVDSLFHLLHTKGSLAPAQKKDTRLLPFFNFRDTDKHHYVFLSPAVGYNDYDNIMLGVVIHNYTLPEPNLHFVGAPLYATGSKTLNAIGKIGYSFLSYGPVRKVEVALSGEKFTMDEYTDSTGKKNYMGFTKLVPSIKVTFRNKTATSTLNKWLAWKTFLIGETGLLFSRDTTRQQNIISYPKTQRYLNQLSAGVENTRALYPYSATFKAEQGSDFMRFTLEGKYFFNYAKGGGMDVRVFAGKFLYLGDNTLYKQFATDRYHLNMTGPNGNEDYTYSNYFAGRNEFQGVSAQQIMIGDGGFKVRSDLLASKIGKTDNWLSAANFTTDFPKNLNPLQVLPVKIPLKLFVDAGTYAEAWKSNAPTGKFIYDAGLQLSLVKNLVNIYIPVVYSKVYADYFKSTETGDRFLKNISFSIDIQNFRFSKFFDQPQL